MDPKLVPFVLFAAIALIVAAAALLIRDLFSRRRRAVEKRLGSAGPALPTPAREGNGNGKSPSFFDQLAADTGADLTGDVAFLATLAAGLVAGGLVFLWNENLVAAAAGAIIGMFAAFALLLYLRARRRRRFLDQLPDATDYLARCVRSGESLDQAIATVGSSPMRPVAGEFRRCARQLEMGLSLESAMRTFARRNPLAEARILAATLTVQRQTGGNLPTALERLARVFRDRLAYLRSFRAATAASRGGFLLIIVVALLLDTYVLIWGPEYVRNLAATGAGQIMLGVSLALQALGALWAYLTLKSDY